MSNRGIAQEYLGVIREDLYFASVVLRDKDSYASRKIELLLNKRINGYNATDDEALRDIVSTLKLAAKSLLHRDNINRSLLEILPQHLFRKDGSTKVPVPPYSHTREFAQLLKEYAVWINESPERIKNLIPAYALWKSPNP